MSNATTFSRIHGFQVVLDCNGERDVVIVSSAGIEDEADVIVRALDAAILGYGPKARITWTKCSTARAWIPTGLQADKDGLCFWAA